MRRVAGTCVAAVLIVLVVGAAVVAEARVPRPTTIASGAAGAPIIFVDGKGTTNVVWTTGGLPHTYYARKPVGSHHFTRVALPGMPSTSGPPFIWSPSSGKLELIVTVNGPLTLKAWTSANDGVSWKHVPTTSLEQSWGADGHYLQTSQMFASPDGILDYDGSNNVVLRLNPALSSATTVASNTSGIAVVRVGANRSGAVFMLGAPVDDYTSPGLLPFQVGTHTGQVSFPCSGVKARRGTYATMAVGHFSAVVAFAGCGHVWTRTLSASGAVGRLISVGASPGATAGGVANGFAWVGLTTTSAGASTLAWTVPGDDIQVAHSNNGSRWKVSKKLVPGIGPGQSVYGPSWSLSAGAASWLGLAPTGSGGATPTEVIALSDSYAPPRKLSARGIAAPHRGALSSLAAVAPGRVSHKKFNRSGKVSLRVVDALGGKVRIDVLVQKVTKSVVLLRCSGQLTVRLKPRKVKQISVPCANGAVVIGGSVSHKPSTKKGDQMSLTVTGRSGSITLAGKES